MQKMLKKFKDEYNISVVVVLEGLRPGFLTNGPMFKDGLVSTL